MLRTVRSRVAQLSAAACSYTTTTTHTITLVRSTFIVLSSLASASSANVRNQNHARFATQSQQQPPQQQQQQQQQQKQQQKEGDIVKDYFANEQRKFRQLVEKSKTNPLPLDGDQAKIKAYVAKNKQIMQEVCLL